MRDAAFRMDIEQIDDSGDLQTLRGRGYANEELTEVHRLMPYGLASNPPAGGHGIGFPIGGRRDAIAFIGGENKGDRPKNLPVGAVALYGPDGQIVSLIEKKCRIVADTSTVIVSGGVTLTIADGKIVSTGEIHAPAFLTP